MDYREIVLVFQREKKTQVVFNMAAMPTKANIDKFFDDFGPVFKQALAENERLEHLFANAFHGWILGTLEKMSDNYKDIEELRKAIDQAFPDRDRYPDDPDDLRDSNEPKMRFLGIPRCRPWGQRLQSKSARPTNAFNKRGNAAGSAAI